MTIIQSIILGIIQGLTEFLPISSSGHLILVPNLLAWEIDKDQAFAFNVLLQAATLVAVVSFFFSDLWLIAKALWRAFKERSLTDPKAKLGLYLLLATIPAGFIGLLLNGFFELVFSTPLIVAVFLIVNSLILLFAERIGNRTKDISNMHWKDAVWVGIFQIFALFPGISRSGATITGGMFRNFDRQSAARFSFLISIPLLAAAGLLGVYKMIQLPDTTANLPGFLVGSIASALVGYLSIRWLLNFLAEKSLTYFSVYCFIFATINLAIHFLSNQ